MPRNASGSTAKQDFFVNIAQLQYAVQVLFPDSALREAYLQNPNSEVLKKAFRSLALAVHPDRNGGHTHDRFVTVSKAYTILSDVPPGELKRVFVQKQMIPRSGRPSGTATPSVSGPLAPDMGGQGRNQPQPKHIYHHPPNTRIKQIPTYQPTGEETFYEGDVPRKQLPLGMYLYYTKQISFQMLAHALAWQRDLRPSMGTLAKAWKWLDDGDIEWILKATAIPGKFAERACRMGYLTHQQSNLLLIQQRSMQPQVGQYFIANGVLSPAQLNLVLRDLARHNHQFST